jgi:hypothetical protein
MSLIWMVITDEGRMFGLSSSLENARRTAKAIDGALIELRVTEDHRPPDSAREDPRWIQDRHR